MASIPLSLLISYHYQIRRRISLMSHSTFPLHSNTDA